MYGQGEPNPYLIHYNTLALYESQFTIYIY